MTYKKMSPEDKEYIAKQYHMLGKSAAYLAQATGYPRRTISHFLSEANQCDAEFWRKFKEQHNRKPAVVEHKEGLKIVVIPDTQVKEGVPLGHIPAAGRYILDHKPDIVVVIGDWWDMPSLNRFGSKMELDGRRVLADLEIGKKAMNMFLDEFYGIGGYEPRMIFTVGNHDPQVRIPRVIEELPNLDGLLVDDTTQWLESNCFEVYDFLEVVNIEGIRFSHYFQNPHSAKKAPLSGQIDTMLKNAGFSFVQGHTQSLKVGKHYLSDGTRRLGIVAGSFYQHEEDYMGQQGNEHWRGIIQLNEVRDGGADVCELSLNYLMRKYGGSDEETL